MSGSPKMADMADAAEDSEGRSAKSACIHPALPPPRWIAAAAAASLFSRRATSTTRAPARANAAAMASPIPELPPVTTAALPCSEKSSVTKFTEGP
jgi:hypothetical protein